VIKNGKAKFFDGSGAYEGTKKVWMRTATSPKPYANWRATGQLTDVPVSFDATTMFAVDSVMTVQMVNSDGTCWTASYGAGDVRKNTTETFIAVKK